MITKNIRFIALALLALIAFSSFAADSVVLKSTIIVSVAGDSPKRTAFLAGDGNRIIAVFQMTNVGNATGAIDYIGFYRSLGLNDVFVEIDGMSHSGIYRSSDLMGVYPSLTLAPGQGVRIVLRGAIDSHASEVSADLVEFGGTYTDGSLPTRRTPVHAVVEELPDEGISNTSIRTMVTPTQPAIMGFVVKGDSNHAYPVLVRAIGPALKSFGVQNPLLDPFVKLYNSAGNIVFENDDWSPDTEWAFQQVGAFSLTKGSFDSAVMVWLTPGAYTVHVKGFGTGTGEVLLEAYQLPRY